jgi:transcriptional regulator GlxA family with amidase domain
MSRATLIRQFKHTVGVSPMTYLLNWRMTKAYHLLKQSNSTVEQIADEVGSTARTLAKASQRHYSMTPSELRRK